MHSSFFSLFFFLFSTSILHAYSSDLDVLLKLKASVVMLRSSGLSDWRDAGNATSAVGHCFFSGVKCDGDSWVIAVKFSGVPLFDLLPPEIGLLDQLVNLTLVDDNLTGELLMEMRKLTAVKVIILANNSFSVDFLKEILAGMTSPVNFRWSS